MTFYQFAQYLQKLEQTASRLAMTEELAKLFQQLAQDEIAQACYLMQGSLVPAHQSLQLNLSTKMVIRALVRFQAQHAGSADAAGKTQANTNLFNEVDQGSLTKNTKQLYKDLGDLGLVAEQLSQVSPQKQLSISQVHQQLVEIAQEAGSGSQERKLIGLVSLLDQLRPVAAKFVIRVIIGKLRLGFSTMTMIDALSWAQTNSKDERKSLELAWQKQADIGRLAELYLQAQTSSARKQVLAQIDVKVGVPVMPALCQRLNTTNEMVEKMGEIIAEPKYDGLRVQLHVCKAGFELDSTQTKDSAQPQLFQTFTRNLDNTTHMFPELSSVIDQLQCQSCILDAEVISYDPKSGKHRSFQQTVKRKRKHGVDQAAEDFPLRFYAFDILDVDGQSLLNQPLQLRKQKLSEVLGHQPQRQSLVKGQSSLLVNTHYIVSDEPQELSDFHQVQLDLGLEGAVMKKKDSIYRAGRKGWRWVKIKEAEGSKGKLSDTLDCIVMGYYRGKGKRTQFGIGAFLVGVLAKDQDKLQTIAKIGTGLTDDQFKDLKQRCNQYEVKSQPKNYQVHKNLLPDVWVQPAIVTEIAADEITNSPVHTAGLALRFPRLVQFRDDKDWEQATSLTELEKLQQQTV
ncbi:MAG: ATP-dependent DNA ligase [Candidatus Pacebacteria bacterium]|nr:ATP-dependent DNA ligase [Candidatus Paceibacterota bacterium]